MTGDELLTAILDAVLTVPAGVPVTDAERTAQVRALAYRAGLHPGQTDGDGRYVPPPHDDGCVVCHTTPRAPAEPLSERQRRVATLIGWTADRDGLHPSAALRRLVHLHAGGSWQAYAARHGLTLDELHTVAQQTGAA